MQYIVMWNGYAENETFFALFLNADNKDVSAQYH